MLPLSDDRILSVYDLDRFIAEADDISSHGYSRDAVSAIRSRLARLSAESDELDGPELEALHGDAADATILRRGRAGSVLMLARFPAEAPTPVHNHNSWGVAHVLRGRDRYERWRLSDGVLELLEELELDPGDSVSFPPPPQDLHAQQGIDDAAWELVFFAADPNRLPRAYYDPATGEAEHREAMG